MGGSMRRDSVPRRIEGRVVPTLRWERAFWDSGCGPVAGVDEVGRGALAGPIVAAAVVFPTCEGVAMRRLRAMLRGVRDSKLLDPESRINLAARIMEQAEEVSLGAVPSWDIDVLGIAAANRIAMERAIAGLTVPPAALLLDAFTVDAAAPQCCLVRGDRQSVSIAAASIVAKVTRDALMCDLDALDDRYAFSIHKGYGTTSHLAALRRFGPGPSHRHSFAPVRDARAADLDPRR